MTRDNDTAVSLDSFSQYRAGNQVWIWVSPVLLVVGSVGNILSFLVLLRKSLRQSTTMFYLACLSLGDLFTLYTGLLRYWIRAAFDVDVRNMSDFSCKFHTFLVYASLDFTVWILVAVTVDRCLSVAMPFRAKRLCTLQRARYVVCILLTLIVLKNMQFLWNLALVDTWEFRCDGRTDDISYFLRQIWPWIDFSTFCLIPFSIMIVCNVKIIYEMVISQRKVKSHNSLYMKKSPNKLKPELTEATYSKLSKIAHNGSREISENPTNVSENNTSSKNASDCKQDKRENSLHPNENSTNIRNDENNRANNIFSRQMSTKSGGNNSNDKAVVPPIQPRSQRRRVSSLTVMLLTVNCVFLLTTSPVQVFLIGEEQWFLSDPDDTESLAWHNFWWSIVNMLQYLNNTIHLFLYCLTGPRFRQELKFMFRKGNRVSTVVTEQQSRTEV